MNPTTETTVPYESSTTNVAKRSVFKDLSLWFLLLSNIITIYFAVTEGLGIKDMVLIYWFQSMTIGFFAFLKLFFVKDYQNGGIRVTDDIIGTLFFLFHFSVFNKLYLTFILNYGHIINSYDDIIPLFQFSVFTIITPLLVPIITFFINHAFSFFYTWSRDTVAPLDRNTIMGRAYIRILPIHIIVLAFTTTMTTQNILILFVIVKTAVDIIMHVIQHRNDGNGQEVLMMNLH